MSSAPFMQLYVSDYLGDTQHLTTEQHGAYLLILMAMWRNGGVLQNDEKKLARIARVNPRRWHLLADDVMAFFAISEGQISQKRLVEEYQKVLSIREKRSTNGKLGGTAKALKSNNAPVANAKQMPKHSHIPDIIEEKIEPKGSPKKTGTRLSADWKLTDEMRTFAMGQGWQIDRINFEADRFKDHWTSSARPTAIKLDWLATWRNWIRNAKPTTGPPGPTMTPAAQRHEDGLKYLDDLLQGKANVATDKFDGSSIDLAVGDWAAE